ADSANRLLVCRSERCWGEVALLQGRLEDASNHFISLLAHAATEYSPAATDAAISLGRLFLVEGHFEAARNIFTEGLDRSVRSGHKTREIAARHGLGRAHLNKGDLEQALAEFTSAAKEAHALGHLPFLGLSLAGGADVVMHQGQFSDAHALLESAIQL